MAFLEKLKASLLPIIAFFRISPELDPPRTPPPPTSILGIDRPTNDLENLQQGSPPSAIDLESSQPPTQPSASPSTNDPETLQPQAPLSTPTTTRTNLRQTAQQHLQRTNSVLPSPPSTINLESSQPPVQPSPPPSTNDPENLQPQAPPATPTTPTNPRQRETILAAQQRLQWTNQVLSFCFSYALALSLQYAQTGHQPDQLNSSFALLSFLVLLAFILILVALFISRSCSKTSQVLEKAAFLVAAAAFCHTAAIPFPYELKCAVLAVFLLSLLLIAIFEYLNHSIA